MKWWPFIILAWNILLNQFVLGVPIPQWYPQLPQYPSFLNIFNTPMPGGRQQSLLNANYTPGEIVTSSGPATNTFDTGSAATFDLFGSGISNAGKSLAAAVGSIIGGQIRFQLFSLNLIYVC